MAKFIKSLFNTSDTKKSDLYDGTPSEDSSPQDIRRTYSISRSGRMKQYNKKRHTLSMELYGENYQQADKSRSVEYHVNNSTIFEVKTHKRNKSSDSKTSQDSNRSALSHRQRTLERSNEENKNH